MALIFVFGSNLAGRHGKGAALVARNAWGAVYGNGVGPQGQSYAIPTKDERLKTLPLATIKKHVDDFLAHALRRPYDRFIVTAIGCGLAGYHPQDIAPMFANATPNCILDRRFLAILKPTEGTDAHDHAC
jgi:hypothetical protein